MTFEKGGAENLELWANHHPWGSPDQIKVWGGCKEKRRGDGTTRIRYHP